MTSRRKHPVNWLGVFFMPKKPPLGHLPWITGRGAGGLIAFILQRDFWKVKKILKKY
uniref:Phospholipase domain containing protein n=1 Tax=Siphoviridae sp. ctuvC1 TaxID=2826507 RepID=A0A8S5M079_9CAUD|nr:MAG TPA: phospholipase domain containing protein [Siphoviridae sp. ctuvC1]